MQKIQLDLTNHPATKMLKEKTRLNKIEIIKDPHSNEEQISIDFNIFQDNTQANHPHRNLIIMAPGYKHIN